MTVRIVLRQRECGEAPRVTNIELFFDLVYVFAVTRLSEYRRPLLGAFLRAS